MRRGSGDKEKKGLEVRENETEREGGFFVYAVAVVLSCARLLIRQPGAPRVKEASPGKLRLVASVHVFLLARVIFKQHSASCSG